MTFKFRHCKFLVHAFFLWLIVGCSNVGPGFANHPIACNLGTPWDDCLPNTKGWENGGGKIYRDAAQKIIDQQALDQQKQK